MNYPDAGQPSPAMYPPAKKSLPWIPIVLGIAGLLLVLAILGGIKAFHAVKDNSAAAITTANSFLANMGRHNYHAAWSQFAPQVQANTPPSSLQDIETLVEKHHGAFVSPGKPQWFIQNVNGQTSVRLTYSAQYVKGNDAVSMVMVKTDNGYQVFDCRYNF